MFDYFSVVRPGPPDKISIRFSWCTFNSSVIRSHSMFLFSFLYSYYEIVVATVAMRKWSENLQKYCDTNIQMRLPIVPHLNEIQLSKFRKWRRNFFQNGKWLRKFTNVFHAFGSVYVLFNSLFACNICHICLCLPWPTIVDGSYYITYDRITIIPQKNKYETKFRLAISDVLSSRIK